MCIASFRRTLVLLFALIGLTATICSAADFAIAHVTVINPGRGEAGRNMTIVVHQDAIVAVLPSKQFRPSSSVKVIKERGRFIIPGLWDMHVHFRDASRDLKMDIANGVLGIRNMGGAPQDVFPLRDAIAAGTQIGPKIVACGLIVDGPDSWSNPQFTVSVRTTEEARAAVESLKKQGSDCIKVYDGLSRDSYYAIIDEAKKVRLPVVGHLPSSISVREASIAGQRSLEHGIALAGGSNAEDEYIKRRLDQSAFHEALRTKNFSLIHAKIARDETFMLDTFDQKHADATYALLAKNGTFLTPTLVTQRALTFADDLIREPDPRMQYISAEDLNWWKPENGMLTKYRTPDYVAMRKREYTKLLEEILRAQSLGVRILAGTDITIPFTYPGFSLHDEMGLLTKAGLTPMQALETATTNPARILGLSKVWGRIDAGFSANFVLLDADPLADIANTEKIQGVVVNGRWLDRSQLDEMLREAKPSSAMEKAAQPELILGERLAREYEKKAGLGSTPELDGISSYVSSVGSQVASVLPSGLQYHFVFDPNPDFKSAFALPGGYIIVGGGLLAIAQTEDELANVLAHEIEHLELGQVSRRVNELARQKEIKSQELSEFLPGYTKEEEFACDLNGQQLAAKAGYSPAGMLTLLETFKALRKGEPEVPSEKHPTLPERIAQAEPLAKASQEKQKPLRIPQ